MQYEQLGLMAKFFFFFFWRKRVGESGKEGFWKEKQKKNQPTFGLRLWVWWVCVWGGRLRVSGFWGPGAFCSGWSSLLPVGTAPFGNHATGDFDDGFLRRKQRRNRTTFTLQQVRMSLCLRISCFPAPPKAELSNSSWSFKIRLTACVKWTFLFSWAIYVSRNLFGGGQMVLTL
jgi:hypothetical protein